MPTLTYPSVIERYYTKYFDKRADRPDQDVCVLVHSNKICLITLSPEHKALKNGPVKSINYVIETERKKVGDVHGKKKLQAIKTNTGMSLCEITSGDGTTYTIRCSVRGKLCELNERLLKDSTLLDKMPGTNGYLAIILHTFCDEKDVCKFLLTEEQYLNGEVIQPAKKPMNVDADAEKKDDGNKESSEELGAEDPKPTAEVNMEADTKETEIMVEDVSIIDNATSEEKVEGEKDDKSTKDKSAAVEVKVGVKDGKSTKDDDAAAEVKVEGEKDGKVAKGNDAEAEVKVDVEKDGKSTKVDDPAAEEMVEDETKKEDKVATVQMEADREEVSKGKKRASRTTKKTPVKRSRK